MPNNNVAILSIMSKFDEKSAREAAKRADKVYEEALSDIGNVNFDEKIVTQFNNALNKIKKNLKGLNLSSYTNDILDSLFSDKDIKEKSADIQKFVNNIESLYKSLGGLGNNDALKSMKMQQLDSIINKQKKIEEYQIKINEKTEEYTNIANKASKTSRKVSTIDKNYGNQDYSKTLELLKNSLSTEKDFTAEQNQSIENLAKLLNLYQVMEKSEPQKGTIEAIRYSKDLLKVTEEIRTECDKIDSFSSKGASDFIKNNGLDSINKVSPYTVIDSKQKFINSSIANMEAQKAKMQSELTNYVSDAVKKNLEKITNDSATAIEKAEKKVENLQNKIESLQAKSTKTGSDNSIIGGIVSDSDVKTLEEIEDRLYAISDLDAEGEATSKQLKEYIQLYKQYEQLISGDSTVKFDPSLKEEYDSIVEADSKLKKYADTLDETIVKQKELNATKSDEKNTSTSVETEQLVKQEEQIKQTVQAEEKLIDTQNQLSSNTKISVDAEQAIADINKVKENLESIPDEKKIKISVNDNDYTNTPLLSDAEGNTITAFRGVVGAWSGLINQDGIGFFTDKLKLATDYADSLAESGKVYQANLSFKNPLEVEGNGAKWDEIDFNGVKKTTDEIVELAKQLGHDGVIFKNIRDGFTDTEEDISNVMVALNAAQIKNEQVIGTVKAGTGEMVDVTSKIDNATDTATNSTVESQNKIQEELKETQKVAEQVSEAMSNVSSNKSNISSGTQIKDVVQGDAEKLGMDNIASDTEEAVQAKKDFATANEGVQSSVDGSKSKLELEAELMNQIAKSAREAADAKKEFVKANTEVKASAEASNNETKKYNTEENANAWKELSYSIQRYSEVSKRISSGNALEGDIEEAERLENKISQLQKLDVLSPTQIEKSEQMLVKLYDKLDDIEKKSKNTSLESMQSELNSYNNKVPEKPIEKNSKFQDAIENYKKAIAEAQIYLNNLGNTPITEEQTKQWKILTDNIEEAKQKMESFSAADRGSDALSRGKEIDTITKYLNKFTGISKQAKQELNGLLKQLQSGDPSVNVKKIHERFLELTVAEREAGREARNLFDIFKDKKIYSFLGQAASMFSFYDIIRYIKEGTSVVKEFDDGLTKISYTMDMTESQFNDLGQSILDMASDINTSLNDAMSVAQIYANMNTTAEEIQKLSEPTLILSNLTGFDASTVADDIQAVTQQFDILAEDSMHIADVYDYISRNISVDYSKGIESIAEAVQVAGSTAKQAGLEYEQLAAIVGKTSEKTRLEGSQIGNGLKTIMTRLSKVGELSDEVDNETMSDASKSLHKIGVEVYNVDGSFRQFDVIMGELANKWSDLTDAEKSNISFAIAATRQTNLLSAVLSNFSDSMQLAEGATNANGNALENNQKWVDSFGGHLQSLENTAQTAWINILDSNTLKGGVDVLNSLLKTVVGLSDAFGILVGTISLTVAQNKLFSGGLKSWFIQNQRILLS